jgi:hypothetical protein
MFNEFRRFYSLKLNKHCIRIYTYALLKAVARQFILDYAVLRDTLFNVYILFFILFFYHNSQYNNTLHITLLLQKFPTASHLLTNRNRKSINVHPIELSNEIIFIFIARQLIDPY